MQHGVPCRKIPIEPRKRNHSTGYERGRSWQSGGLLHRSHGTGCADCGARSLYGKTGYGCGGDLCEHDAGGKYVQRFLGKYRGYRRSQSSCGRAASRSAAYGRLSTHACRGTASRNAADGRASGWLSNAGYQWDECEKSVGFFPKCTVLRLYFRFRQPPPCGEDHKGKLRGAG